MASVWVVARAELRRRWRSWVALAVLLGVIGGIALATVAGARRTSTAFDRLLVRSDAHDVEVQIVEEVREDVLDDIEELPQVIASGRVALFPAGKQAPGGDPEPFKWDVTAAAVVGDGLARELDIPRLRGGREMRFDDPHEAMASEAFTKQRGLAVGDQITIQLATWPEVFELFGGRFPIPTAPEATVRIVGVWKLPHDVSIAGQDQGLLYLSPAFARTYAAQAATFEGLMVRLRNGRADVDSFVRDARALAENPEALSFTTQDEINADVQRAVDVMAVGLWIFSGILGAVALLVIGQSIARAMAAGAGDMTVLRALSIATGQRAAILALPACAVALGGAALAVVVALAVSPVMPLGFVREIEPEPGFSADVAALGVGAVAILGAMVARALWPAVRIARRAARQDPVWATRPSLVAGGAARAGLSPAAVTGVRFALEPGRGASAVPMRSALGGMLGAMIAVVAVFSFGPSLDRLIDRPGSFGWTWDAMVFGGEDPEFYAEQRAALQKHPSVDAYAAVAIRTTTVGDAGLQLIGLENQRGTIEPVVIEGRAPRAPDEIALGAKAMRTHDVAIGDTMSLPAASCESAACPLPFRVVGKVVPPPLDGADLGAGAIVTLAGVERVRTTGGFIDFAVRLRPGVDLDEAVAAFEEEFGDATVPTPPVELLNLDRVRALPDTLAVLLALVGLAVMGHALLTAARRRGRDLAILKTIGFRRSQVRAALAWHATTMIVVALVIAVPVGVAAARWLWRITSDRLGVTADPAVSVTALAAGALSLIVASNVVAALPARRAARTEPAVVLRAE